MGDSFGSRIIRAFQMGQQQRMAREQQAQQQEDLKLRREMLMDEARRLKLQEKLSARGIIESEAMKAGPQMRPIGGMPDPGNTGAMRHGIGAGLPVSPEVGVQGQYGPPIAPMQSPGASVVRELQSGMTEEAPTMLPGIPEIGLPERELRPGEQTRRMMQQQMMAEAMKSFTLGPGQRRFVGGQEVGSAPPNPVSVAPGGSLVNPQTGTPTYTAPARPDTSVSEVEVAQKAAAGDPGAIKTLELLQKGRKELKVINAGGHGGSGGTGRSLDALRPETRSRVESLARRVAAGELTTYQANSLLGGVRANLGGALSDALDALDARIVPSAVRTQMNATDEAIKIIDRVGSMVNEIQNAKQRGDTKAFAAQSKIMEDFLKQQVPLMARAVGHVGVLTQQDVDSVRGFFPGWKSAGFAPAFAQEKIKVLRERFNEHKGILMNEQYRLVPRGEGAPARPSGGGTVKMTTPDGRTWDVPADKVEAAKARGAVPAGR